jgi:hypothetical protein
VTQARGAQDCTRHLQDAVLGTDVLAGLGPLINRRSALSRWAPMLADNQHLYDLRERSTSADREASLDDNSSKIELHDLGVLRGVRWHL